MPFRPVLLYFLDYKTGDRIFWKSGKKIKSNFLRFFISDRSDLMDENIKKRTKMSTNKIFLFDDFNWSVSYDYNQWERALLLNTLEHAQYSTFLYTIILCGDFRACAKRRVPVLYFHFDPKHNYLKQAFYIKLNCK